MKNVQLRDDDKILFQFSRPAIEAGDFSGFLDAFGLERLPTGPALRPLFKSFGFVADGFDEDQCEWFGPSSSSAPRAGLAHRPEEASGHKRTKPKASRDTTKSN